MSLYLVGVYTTALLLSIMTNITALLLCPAIQFPAKFQIPYIQQDPFMTRCPELM